MFCYQSNFSNPTMPVDEAQFFALVRATQWNESIDKYRETGEASYKRKLPGWIFPSTFDITTSKAGKEGRLAQAIGHKAHRLGGHRCGPH